jgi:signal transduction histidine kinase
VVGRIPDGSEGAAAGAAGGRDAWLDGWIALEGAGCAMVVCDAEQRLLGASPEARSLFLRAGITLGAPPQRLPDELWISLDAAISGQALWRQQPRGSLIGISRYLLGSSHSLLVMREVPDHSRVHPGDDEQEHGQLARRLHEQRLEVTGRLVVTLAHDLRNPLASILLNVEVLRAAAGLDAETRGAVEDVRAAVERVRRAIDALVEFGRLGPPSVAEVFLEDVLARVVGALRPVLREGHHHLQLDLRDLSVLANALLLEQIVANLITNAVESCGAGVTVAVGAERDGERVRLSVSDNGPGIAPELRERVFRPFHTTRLGRMGLGLTIAREAAISMGGEIVALEAEGGGARLVLTLPAPPGASP